MQIIQQQTRSKVGREFAEFADKTLEVGDKTRSASTGNISDAGRHRPAGQTGSRSDQPVGLKVGIFVFLGVKSDLECRL